VCAGVREAARVDGVHPVEVRLEHTGELLLTFGRPIDEPGPERRSSAGVDAERGRRLRGNRQQIVGDVVEQGQCIGVALRGGRRRCALAAARGHQRERGRGCERRQGFATREESVNHGDR
jgi:hypothetical protein